MVIYPLVLPVPPPLKGVGGTRALAHSIMENNYNIYNGGNPFRGSNLTRAKG